MYVIHHVKSNSTKRVLVSISLLAGSNFTHTIDPKINKKQVILALSMEKQL